MRQTTARPYLSGAFAPVTAEHDLPGLEIDGRLPAELSGVFLRNGPNPRFDPPGRYHWFDGDGMVHAVELAGGQAHYRNRWVRTPGLEHEQVAGESLWAGILEPLRGGLPGGPLKNTANTDLVWHSGRLLALWWLGGTPSELALPSLDTRGPCTFEGRLPGGLAAHPKVCPRTGEMMFIDFSFHRPPWCHHGVVSADGSEVRVRPLELAAPHILHDIALTASYTVVIDCPLGWDLAALRQGKRRIGFDRDAPTRFGLVPRDGGEVRWFEDEACYIFHTINAWQEDDAVVLLACRVADPLPRGREPTPGIPRLHFLDLEPFLYRFRFDLRTGRTEREQLDDVPTEFPRQHDGFLGRPSRFCYNPRIAPENELLFSGFIKYDLAHSSSQQVSYGAGRYGGEVVFAPRPDGTEEDDGWLLTFVHEAADGTTGLWVYDAKEPSAGPRARIRLPVRVPLGFHACWVDGRELGR